MAETERIIQACIRHHSNLWHAPPPKRHHDIMALMREHGINDVVDPRDQGFIAARVIAGEVQSDTARFVSRAEAALIAHAAGQLIREPTPPNNLTSEDVW